MKPIIKWAGGKARLLQKYPQLFPAPDSVVAYFEPFLGGGAVATYYLGKTSCVLSDANARLIQMYRGVRDDCEAVIAELKALEYDEQTYYHYRDLFNMAEARDVDRAAWFIYLNKTGFNGLYRESRKGQYNVPFGRYVNPTICDEDVIRAWSKMLRDRRTALYSADFEQMLNAAGPGCFCFLDSPYVPVSTTANFTAYVAEGFGPKDQARLAAILEVLDQKRVKFLLTNSGESRSLYGDRWHVMTIPVSRSINCKGIRRGAVDEIAITNYAVSES